jgi:hypothetical protein
VLTHNALLLPFAPQICRVDRTPAQMGCPSSCSGGGSTCVSDADCKDTLSVSCASGQTQINLQSALTAQTLCNGSVNTLEFKTSGGQAVASPASYACPATGASDMLTVRATNGANSCYNFTLVVNGACMHVDV